jgi:hypothetical protein
MIQRVARQSLNSSALLSEASHADADLMLYSSWAAAKAARLAGPSNPGSKAIPPAAVPDCLAGLSFVFTGELSSFSREEAVDIAKRFCGWVLSSPYISSQQPLTLFIPAAWWANRRPKLTMSCSVTTLARANLPPSKSTTSSPCPKTSFWISLLRARGPAMAKVLARRRRRKRIRRRKRSGIARRRWKRARRLSRLQGQGRVLLEGAQKRFYFGIKLIRQQGQGNRP